jgi:acetylornithine deacetylase/succinyl-diaminopimelate desuccinylase-like protein
VAVPTADHVPAALAAARAITSDVLDLTLRIAAIPAPTGHEGTRSRFVAGWLQDAGAPDLATDQLGDVVLRLPGRGLGAPVLIAAHLDTVFPAATALDVRRVNGRLHGPGVGDNSLGVAAVLLLPKLLAAMGVRPATDLLLALTVGEEGLGNLRGMRAVVEANPKLGAAVAVEGHNLGRVTHVAVGSRRLRIRVEGPGGHSWGDFGQPSAIHALARIVADLDALPTSTSPKTTLNVGLVEGGFSVNTIAPSASCVLDLRSTDEGALRRLTDKVVRVVEGGARGGIRTSYEVLGERPAGVVPLGSRIVEIATRTLTALGVAAICDASSTDANIPISRGVPAVCLGLTAGGNVHRVDEYVEVGQVPAGLAQLAVVALRLSEEIAAGRVGPGRP